VGTRIELGAQRASLFQVLLAIQEDPGPTCLVDYMADNGINKYANCGGTGLDKLNNT
jgi:hypothetical protein